MSNTLYDEAIADAKKLRELAEKNAKQAIIEAVTPKIRKFIEDQLINDANSEKDESLLEDISRAMSQIDESGSDVVLSEGALDALMGIIDSNDDLRDVEKRKFENALSETAQNLNSREREKLLEITRKLKKDVGTLSHDDIVIGQELNNINIKENSEMPRKNETLYEVDLNDITSGLFESSNNVNEADLEEKAIRELMSSMTEDDHEESSDPMSEIYKLLEQDDEAALPAEEDPAALPAEDPGALPADEGPELPPAIDDAIAALEDAIAGAVGGGEAEAELEPGIEDLGAEAPAGVDDLAETVEVDLDMLRSEIRRMKNLSEGGGKKTHQLEEGSGDVTQENRKLRRAILNQGRQNRSLGSKLDEYRSAVQSLREQLTEMNLFNAKLLYVNKMLQNGDVSSSQRRSIIEALDSARSLREVKLLYKSLAESIGNRKSGRTLNESAVRRNLGSASRATRQASSTNSQVAEVSRWATLAGINK